MRGRNLLVIVLSGVLAIALTGNFPALAAEKKAKERLAVLDLEAKHGVEKSLAEALSVIVRDKLHGFVDGFFMGIWGDPRSVPDYHRQ